MFLPQEGMIKWRNICQSFSFCQSESFCIRIIPNLWRKKLFIPKSEKKLQIRQAWSDQSWHLCHKEVKKQTNQICDVILYLACNVDSSTLILKSLDHHLRRWRGKYDGGRYTHFSGCIGCSHTCVTTYNKAISCYITVNTVYCYCILLCILTCCVIVEMLPEAQTTPLDCVASCRGEQRHDKGEDFKCFSEIYATVRLTLSQCKS